MLIERSLAVNGGIAVRRSVPDGLAWRIELPLPKMPAVMPSDAAPPPCRDRSLCSDTLQGRRVLVVEEEPLVALEIETELAAAGANVVGPVGIIEAAARLIETEPLDAALLEATLAGEPVDALTAALAARRVPFAFVSGLKPACLPVGFRGRPLIGKPFSAPELVALIRSLFGPEDSCKVVPLQRRD
jgi:hypothetical protein